MEGDQDRLMRGTIKRAAPRPILRAAAWLRDSMARGLSWPAATWHPWRRESIRKLQALKDAHRGERCFILGNGPSLKRMDLTKLQGEYSFGMNRIYLLFPDLGFSTPFYVSVNDLVIEQCAEDIQRLKPLKFLSWRARGHVGPAPDIVYLYTTYTGPKFARDARRRLWEGATVTYVALQVAYHMGFSPVILVGVDHSFKAKGAPNETVVSQGEDVDHFDPGYFGEGFRWQLPDLDTSERAYRMARQAFESDGRQVLDATVGGRLEVFPKVEYDSLFDSHD
jgi:hypothetical protein